MNRCLVIDLLPYEHSTRTKKIAVALASSGRSTPIAVTLSQVGRVGLSAQDVASRVEDGVDVNYVKAGRPSQRRSRLASAVNLLLVYPPALTRLLRWVISTPAESIFVGHMALFWLGMLHRLRFGSHVALNARERLGGVRTQGSLGATFSRIEPFVLRCISGRSGYTVVAAAPGHAEEYRALGMDSVITVRNAPSVSFSPPYREPSNGPLTFAFIGSLYEGRGVFPLIDAIDLAADDGLDVKLEISGRGNPDFVSSMKARIFLMRHPQCVDFLGECAPSEVPGRYQRAHVATALYEPVDAANDSLSNKLFEGPASGRPVLAGDLPENSRVVRDYALGWTATVTAEGLRQALHHIYAERERIGVMGRHCHEVCANVLNWECEVEPLIAQLTREG